jgi:hypothetical protein
MMLNQKRKKAGLIQCWILFSDLMIQRIKIKRKKTIKTKKQMDLKMIKKMKKKRKKRKKYQQEKKKQMNYVIRLKRF